MLEGLWNLDLSVPNFPIGEREQQAMLEVSHLFTSVKNIYLR